MAREKKLEQAMSKAKLYWEKLAKEKDWSQVKTDLSVYRYSGEEVKEDPRAGAAYAGCPCSYV